MKQKLKTLSLFDSIYTKFFVQLVLLTFIPIALISILFSFNMYQGEKDRRYELNNQVNTSVVNNINVNLEFTSRITQSLLSSNELNTFLKNPYSVEADYDNYIASIQSYVKAAIQSDSRSDIFIYMENSSIPMSMDVFYHLDDIRHVAAISDFLDSDAIDLWLCGDDFSDTSDPYLFPVSDRFIYLRKAYDYKKSFLGLLVFSISEKYFLSFDAQEEGTLISKGHSRIINLSGDTLDDAFLSDMLAKNETCFQLDSYLAAKETLPNFPFTIITVTKRTNYGQLLLLFVFILVSFACFSLILCLRNLKKLVSQMDDCLTAMDISIHNNYTTRIPVKGNNEISHICERINLLLNQAALLSEQNIRKETSNKETRLIALQHQINPHFIYNTMEVFSSKMKLYGHYEESDAMVAFANIFRYNISTNDALVTVAEELRQMHNYLNIQKLRYTNISLIEDIDPALQFALIPKFTFQPIIENAISHGLTSKEQPLTLTVSASVTDDFLSVSILDNGIGMLPRQLENLKKTLASTEEISTDGHSVGLKNINTRLILYFGESSHLTIESRHEKYTKVSFRIPYTQKVLSS